MNLIKLPVASQPPKSDCVGMSHPCHAGWSWSVIFSFLLIIHTPERVVIRRIAISHSKWINSCCQITYFRAINNKTMFTLWKSLKRWGINYVMKYWLNFTRWKKGGRCYMNFHRYQMLYIIEVPNSACWIVCDKLLEKIVVTWKYSMHMYILISNRGRHVWQAERLCS